MYPSISKPARSMENDTIMLNCSLKTPTAIQVVTAMDTLALVLFVTLTTMAAVAVAVGAEAAGHFLRVESSSVQLSRLLWVNEAGPVLTILACVGMWVPRAAMFMDHAASIYVGCYLHSFMELMLSESGNEGWPFSRWATLRLRTGPLCCCCLCLPNPRLTSRWLTALRCGTLQTAILRPLLVLFSLLVWAEGMASGNWENANSMLESALGYVLGASTLLAIWVLSMAFFIVRNFTLPRPHLTARFALNQVLVLFVTLQSNVLRKLSSAGIIPCIPPFSRHAQATSMDHQLLIIEMFVVTLTSHRLYRHPVKQTEAALKIRA
uniref:organic solute transporter subunit alpha-like isoform X1 n=2 Tax=Myxine glutinosa TaxID=7769 RepID=UPI00358DE4E5